MTDLTFPKKELPHFSIQSDDILPNIRHLLEINRQKLAAILAQTSHYSWENLMQPLEEMGEELSKYWSPISHLHSVAETESLRKAYNEALPLITEYHTEISQNTALFNAIASLTTHPEFEKFNPAQHKIVENDIRDFKLAGIHLPTDKKEE
ncbi:MAG: oligopeptidase A, partial [Gammaproteobacteria bacterium]|nr:oligopeptidase A [Gammaproteobacteria bacterium]